MLRVRRRVAGGFALGSHDAPPDRAELLFLDPFKVLACHDEVDLAVSGGELDRVAQELAQHLDHPVLVPDWNEG